MRITYSWRRTRGISVNPSNTNRVDLIKNSDLNSNENPTPASFYIQCRYVAAIRSLSADEIRRKVKTTNNTIRASFTEKLRTVRGTYAGKSRGTNVICLCTRRPLIRCARAHVRFQLFPLENTRNEGLFRAAKLDYVSGRDKVAE